MVASEHPEMIYGRRLLIAVDVLDPEEEYEDGSIDDYDAVSDEEDESGLVEAGVSTVVTEVGTK